MPGSAVSLRSLSATERTTLARKLRQVSLPVRLHRRYRVIEEVRRGRSVREAAERAGINLQSAYDWLHRFNASGFRTFEAASNPRGRIPIISTRQIRELVDVALSSPAERGLPFSTWSVHTLTEYCRSKGLIPEFSDEWVRRLLRREGLSAQRIKTWKTSEDPQFDPKGAGSARSMTTARRARRSSVSTSGGRSS
jgi:transposase